ncbi:phage tail tube protein [Zavarzinella formosa]|uniref:phage tail tube protein n=1 Tax=Zavarzinella formosa TaxID=360055 RepID=UPI0002DE2814|nr:phage tail tube protein [Zavarzinella formosa]
MTYLNGFGGNAEFATSTLQVESWSLNINAESLDTTNTGDAGWVSNITGAKSAEGSCKAYFDVSAVPTGAAGLLPGSSGTLTLNLGASGKAYMFTARITQISVENAAKGVVTFGINFVSTGAVTYAS